MEDVKGALMDDMKAMMQNELRQALAELMPPLAPTAVILPVVVAPFANPLIVDAPPTNNNNAGGQPLNAARNAPAAVAPIVANPPVVDAPPANNDNAGGNL